MEAIEKEASSRCINKRNQANCKTTGSVRNALSRSTEFKVLIVIQVLNARQIAPFVLAVDFSDQTHGTWDASAYLSNHTGPLLEPLRDAAYFERFFIDAGALCWPNGLEISPARIYKISTAPVAA